MEKESGYICSRRFLANWSVLNTVARVLSPNVELLRFGCGKWLLWIFREIHAQLRNTVPCKVVYVNVA